MNSEQYQLFQSIKGKPLTILFLFFMVGGVMTYQNMEKDTGYSRPTLRTHLDPLIRLGFIVQTGGNLFQMTEWGKQLFMFPEKIFQLVNSNDSIINIKDIESLPTTTCKIFTPNKKLHEYLQLQGVWANMIDGLCYQLDNDLELAKLHFKGTDLRLAVYRIQNQLPPDPQYSNQDFMCIDCYSNPCECDI